MRNLASGFVEPIPTLPPSKYEFPPASNTTFDVLLVGEYVLFAQLLVLEYKVSIPS